MRKTVSLENARTLYFRADAESFQLFKQSLIFR